MCLKNARKTLLVHCTFGGNSLTKKKDTDFSVNITIYLSIQFSPLTPPPGPSPLPNPFTGSVSVSWLLDAAVSLAGGWRQL